MASKSEKIDIERTKKTAEHVFNVLGGALVSAMIYLGDRMGLYQALNGAGAVTSEELARMTGLHERWLRESFKSGMGLTYDQLGPEVNRGVERLLAPWFRTQLVPAALPKLDGVVGKLPRGAKV